MSTAITVMVPSLSKPQVKVTDEFLFKVGGILAGDLQPLSMSVDNTWRFTERAQFLVSDKTTITIILEVAK